MTKRLKWGFDNNSLGRAPIGAVTLDTHEVERPRGLTTLEWYSFAGKLCRVLNKEIADDHRS